MPNDTIGDIFLARDYLRLFLPPLDGFHSRIFPLAMMEHHGLQGAGSRTKVNVSSKP